MKSPEELQSLIHEVVPSLPLPALELLEELGAIGQEAELAQELAHTLALVRRSTPAPTLSDGFADSLMAALPAGPPPAAGVPGASDPLLAGSPGARSPWAGFVASFLLGVGLTSAWGWIDTTGPAPAPERAPAEPANSTSHEAELTPAAPAPSVEVAPAEDDPAELDPALDPDQRAPEEDLGTGVVEAGHEPQTAPVDPALARLANEGDPVQSYVARASIVFEALERLDTKDPRVSRALALHLERTELLEQGERLLIAIEYEPAGNRLRPLIRGAQVVLRKVRHVPVPVPAPAPSAPDVDARPGPGGSSLSAIRQEVRLTGLLAACRELLATPEPDEEPTETPGETRDL